MKDHVMIHHDGKAIVQGVSMGQGRLPIMDITRRLLDTGLERICFENVWSYNAPLLTPEKNLPHTACFEFDNQLACLTGDELSQDDALNGEMVAFRQGWDWLRNMFERDEISLSQVS